ncbi:RhtX/FptX family siderophore transporter [Tistrella mobilis]|uniref:RhtX/FptX family siderophore transporter n=1 Tax=Tistrella mobilis TaxID=171437 RepID=UPI003558CE38
MIRRTGRPVAFLMITALYVTQGIPLGLAMEALPGLLRQQGAALDRLAFLPLVGLPWVLKFLWAPLIDDHWSPRIGRRRSWVLPMQSLVLATLLAVVATGVSESVSGWLVAGFALASLASATQDTATDGLAAEHFQGRDLARANGIQVAGTMIGFFFGGSGTLVMAGLIGLTGALLVVAGVVAAGLVLALFWREGLALQRGDAPRSRASLKAFATRPGALPLLAVALLSAVTASAGFGLWKLFLIDAGWTIAAVGRLGIAAGAVTILLGCGGGAWMVTRFGAWRALFAGLGASGGAALAWSAQAVGVLPLASTPSLLSLPFLAAALGAFGAGAASVAAMALAMRFAASAGQAGTDMTSVQSTRDLGEIGTSSAVTLLAASAGYGGAFLAVAAAAGLAVAAVYQARRSAALRLAEAGLREAP